MIILNDGPAVHLKIELHNDMLHKVSLSCGLKNTMSFEMVGGTKHTQDVITSWLTNYAHKKSLGAPFPLAKPESFTQLVHTALTTISFGKTISYQDLAHKLKSPRAARAVGSACGKNPYPLFIPCHRVIKSDGSLGGFAVDLEIKRRLLAFEAQGHFEGKD